MTTAVIQTAATVLRDPRGAGSRIPAYLDKRRDQREWRRSGRSPQDVYGSAGDWSERLHGWFESPPCVETEFEAIWRAMGETMGVGDPAHVRLAGQFDPLPFFARAVWCAARHLAPQCVLETGVARGITSRLLLEALEHNGRGHLWSIDLPHPANDQLGAAVTPELRPRWSLRLGRSRTILPGLLSELGEVELFVHDSLHTGRNVELELRTVWPYLAPGGLLLADDIHQSLGFHRFVECEGVSSWFAAPRGIWGLFGVARKEGGRSRT